MIIKLNTITTALAHNIVRSILPSINLSLSLFKYSHYQFCTRKNKQTNNNQPNNSVSSDKNEIKGPKIIEISKQQFESMKKFLQDIRLSNPDIIPSPAFPASLTTTTKKNQYPQNTNSTQQQSSTRQTTQNNSQSYFSSQQHKLSFQLLKLTSTSHFVTFMQKYKQHASKSIKLIILHRYCSVGGIVNQFGSEGQKLGYFMFKQLLDNMHELQQNQLVQFLQLYIGQSQINQQNQPNNTTLSSLKKIKTNQLPRYQSQRLDKSPPLIKNPSHNNSRLIVLLLHFMTIQYRNLSQQGQAYKLNDNLKPAIVGILQHYQLYTQQIIKQQRQSIKNYKQQKSSQIIENQADQYPQCWQYSLKDITFILIQSLICQRQQNTSIRIFLNTLQHISSTITNIKDKNLDNKPTNNIFDIIRCCQYLLQNIHRISNITTSKTKQTVANITQKLVKIIQPILQMSINMKQLNQQTMEQNSGITSVFNNQFSTTITSLLYKSIISIYQHPSNVQFTTFPSQVYYIAHKICSIGNLPILSLQQYSECWQSCMVMYKIIKSSNNNNNNSNKTVKQSDIYKLVNNFLTKVELDVWLKLADDQQSGGKAIQEYLKQNQRLIFQCLVGYRMVMLPDLLNKNNSFNVSKQLVNVQAQCNSRTLLCNLLTAYHKTQQSIYKCNLISNAKSSQIHNLIIAIMIAQAYPSQNSINKIKTLSHYLLTPTICQILVQYGINHERYGAYVQKILHKYQLH